MSRVIPIGKGPVQTIEAVTVYDAAGAPVPVDVSGFVLDGQARPARLILPRQPELGRAINGIEIDFSAGFGASGTDVPDILKRAMLLHAALLYEFRGAVPPDNQPAWRFDGGRCDCGGACGSRLSGWGGVVAILASCANLLRLEIAPEDESGIVDGLTALIAAVGGLIAIWDRISASKRLR